MALSILLGEQYQWDQMSQHYVKLPRKYQNELPRHPSSLFSRPSWCFLSKKCIHISVLDSWLYWNTVYIWSITSSPFIAIKLEILFFLQEHCASKMQLSFLYHFLHFQIDSMSKLQLMQRNWIWIKKIKVLFKWYFWNDQEKSMVHLGKQRRLKQAMLIQWCKLGLHYIIIPTTWHWKRDAINHREKHRGQGI